VPAIKKVPAEKPKMLQCSMQIEGRNPVIELLRSKRFIDKVMVEEGVRIDAKIGEILKRAQNRGVFIERAPKKKLDKISQTKSHQGVIATAKIDFVDFGGLIAENFRHKKPNNFIFGAIARSAEAAGFAAVILAPKQAITAQAFRSSMGALANIHLCRESIFNAIKVARREGIQVVGIEVSGDRAPFEADLAGDTMLIIGGEDRSLSDEITAKCDTVVKIPMRGKINSLNMSVASSIVIFEKLRQELTQAKK
jgi:23S rRNA (guanosine2251-2'-O)-methyltransferase